LWLRHPQPRWKLATSTDTTVATKAPKDTAAETVETADTAAETAAETAAPDPTVPTDL
jgi:hypothetical protein